MQTQELIGSLNQRVEHYLELASRTLRNFDPDTIHDFRVASRNLMVIAPWLTDDPDAAVWYRQVKRSLKMLNGLRDLQVLKERLEMEGEAIDALLDEQISHELKRWNRESPKLASKQFRDHMTRGYGHFSDTIERSPGRLDRMIARECQSVRERLLARLNEVDTTRPRSLHKLRIAYKSFRYLVAMLHDVGALPELNPDEFKHWQDILGAIQDDEVACAWLIEYFPQKRELIRSIRIDSERLRDQFQTQLPQFSRSFESMFEPVICQAYSGSA